MKKTIQSISLHDFTTKLSASIVYAILASIAMNFFFQPGHIYSSGVTGLSQILTTVSEKFFGFGIQVSLTYYLLNIPLFFIAWKTISKKFTIFTFITVTLTSIFIHLLPETTLTTDPIICAIFGGAISGAGIGFALRNGLSSGGLDIFSITIRKRTGKTIGSVSIYFNAVIVFVAGYLFGWQYMFYSALSIFISGKVTDVVYTKQKKMQVTIITRYPEQVINELQQCLRRGITIINDAEGAYAHDKQKVLITVVTRFELPLLQTAMKKADPAAFVSIADNVQILGRFYEEEL